MAKSFSIPGGTEDKIGFFHLAGFLATLPFDRFYSQVILISFIFHTLIHLRIKRSGAAELPELLVLSSVFLVNVAGMLWSPDKGEAIKDIQRQVVLILFPLLFCFTNLPVPLIRKKLLLVFGITCTVLVLYLFADAFRIIYLNGMPARSIFSAYFINHNFSEPIGLHATYFSMYVALSLAVCMVYASEENNKLYKRLYVTGILILVAGLIQLASRSVLIATLAFSIAAIILLPGNRTSKLKHAILITGGAVIILLLITGIESFQKRFIREFRTDLSESPAQAGYHEPRIDRWRCAYNLAREAPFIGHGSGSEKRLLKEKYFERKLYISFLRELNAHNQYLSAGVKWGLAGLLIFLFTLGLGFRLALQRRDMVFLAFMVLVSVVSFSENILDVNKGIFFYAFFFSFFWYSGKPLAEFQRFRR